MPVQAVPKTGQKPKSKPSVTRPWVVILFNDDIHSFDEVILQLQKATGCSNDQATKIAMEAHFKGKAVAFQGSFRECHRVSGILKEIGLLVEIRG
ncbi:ATP-dependent Clp protease adaptor ClpS [bacterium]|nr:ATP-dependent Clp protease adaptor ClpS [bacterium]